MCASSRLTWRGTDSSPVWSISPRSCAQSATWFIDARYWLQAEANRPSWSPSSRGSGPGTRSDAAQAEVPLAVPEHEPAHLGRQEAELRERVGRLAQHGALGVAEHAVPGLLRVVHVRPGELDRVLEVLVVDVQELERRLALVEQVQRRDRAGPRLAAQRDLAQGPDTAPALDVDPPADLGERLAVLERVTLLGASAGRPHRP